MFEILIPILMALISFFTAKKSGAKDSTAALAAAAGGIGTYYVATQTDWGKSTIASIDSGWATLTGSDGQALTNSDGTTATAPAGAVADTNADGSVKRDANGNVMWKALDTAGQVVKTTGGVLTSWGAAGTSAVIGTTAAASGGIFSSKNLPYLVLGGLALVMVLK